MTRKTNRFEVQDANFTNLRLTGRENCLKVVFNSRAAGLGLEPRYTVPETAVLPLDDPAITNCLVTAGYWKNPVFSTCTKTIYTEPKC